MTEAGFGIRLPIGGSAPGTEAIRRTALEAERLGYGYVYARDNITWSKERQLAHISEGSREVIDDATYIPDHFDATVVFSYLASITQKIKFVYSIAVLNFRSPIVWAKQLATLDVMSNGRVILGIGAGGNNALGVPPETRGARCDEAFYAIRELWTKPSASFNGKYIRFTDVVQYPKPVQKPYPPVIFGASDNVKPGIVRRVAEYCDGWFPQILLPAQIEDTKRRIREKAKQYGRGDKEFIVHLQVPACIAKTDEDAWKKAGKTMLADDRQRVKDPEHILPRTLIGSPDTIIKQVDSYARAGVTDFELLFVYPTIDDMMGQMKMVTEMVVPSFTMHKG